jgi:micrococcal nuclease
MAPPPLANAPDGEPLEGSLLHVRDGDTVEVRYGDLPLALRLRCVDTAESVHPDAARNSAAGAAASAWAKSRLAGARVRVEFVRRGWAIDMDRHGRAIAWLWVLGEGEPQLFNEELIRAGHSRYETGFGSGGPYHARLQAAEDEARRARRGLWAR